MRLSSSALFACVLILFLGTSLDARQGLPSVIVGTATSSSVQTTSPGQIAPAPSFRVITNEPYSAVQVTETVQTLADGSHVTSRGGDQKIYRDSQGRIRIELYPPAAVINEDPSVPRSIIIRDPVEGVIYMLDTKAHTATVQHENFSSGPQNGSPAPARPAPRPSVRVNPSAPPPIRMTSERLGTQIMEGVSVEGVRNTEVIPAGARGNDEPIKVVMERWFSSELGDYVLMTTSDPRSGDRTIRLTNIDRSEPDPALFQVPVDYKIVPPPQ